MEEVPLNSEDRESDSDDSISRYQQVSSVHCNIASIATNLLHLSIAC